MSDVNDIDAKINKYCEKNEQFKKSLQPHQERKSLLSMFENYAESFGALSQKDSSIKQLKDKVKQINTENAKIK